MKPGPAKKPTNLKLLEGNAGRRPLPANEPKPALLPGVPRCPAYMKGLARQEWYAMASELQALGLLTRVDHAALEGYCVNYEMFVEADSEISRLQREYKAALRARRKNPKSNKPLPSNGMVVYTSNGNAIMEPMLSVRKQAAEMMHKFLAEFGMTPASRAGEGGGNDKPGTPMQALLRATKSMVN